MRLKINQDKFADLHIHTTFSDSTLSPEQVVKQASEIGLCAIAITDHDCVSGIPLALTSSAEHDIEIIPGVELTANLENTEAHILGYYIDWKREDFIQKLNSICSDRLTRMRRMVEKLKNIGVNIKMDDVLTLSAKGSVGRMHLARVLEREGYVSSVEEAFKKFIADNGPCYVPRSHPTVKEAVGMIESVGGIAVLAHPHTLKNDKIIEEIVKKGVKGIEAYYPNQHKSLVKKYKEIAIKYNLLLTGGSDNHGLGKEGFPMGGVNVSYELVEKLKGALNRNES